MSDSLTIYGSLPGSPGTRGCCLLTHTFLFDLIIDLNDPTMSLDHQYGTGTLAGFIGNSEKSGIIYTCDLGFIDLGHLRDLADLTLYYYMYLNREGENAEGSVFPTFDYKGHVELFKNIPPEKRLDVASSIAYDQSVFHEIETYWVRAPGYHNSSFSPEDLVSNALGTYVARLVIRSLFLYLEIDAFNKGVTAKMKDVLTSLHALDRAGTLDALSKIEGLWVTGSSLLEGFLQRRNFGFGIFNHLPIPIPWIVPGVTGCTFGFPSIPWLSPLLGRPQSDYAVTFTIPSRPSVPMIEDKGLKIVTNSTFKNEIDDIIAHAKVAYGPDCDKPG